MLSREPFPGGLFSCSRSGRPRFARRDSDALSLQSIRPRSTQETARAADARSSRPLGPNVVAPSRLSSVRLVQGSAGRPAHPRVSTHTARQDSPMDGIYDSAALAPGVPDGSGAGPGKGRDTACGIRRGRCSPGVIDGRVRPPWRPRTHSALALGPDAGRNVGALRVSTREPPFPPIRCVNCHLGSRRGERSRRSSGA